MPEMDGAALSIELRASRPDLRSILISGNANVDQEITHQFDRFVPKPTSGEKLAAIARGIGASRQSSQ